MKGKGTRNTKYETLLPTSAVGAEKELLAFGGGKDRAKPDKATAEKNSKASFRSKSHSSKTSSARDELDQHGSDFGRPSIATNGESDSELRRKIQTVFSGKKLFPQPNTHTFTYVGLLLFTLVLYFRPYELIPALSGFHSIALILALATVIIYVPSQFTAEGTLTVLPVEVKCIIFIMLWALLTIPIAKDPGLAWATFSDTFIKVVLMFIIMVNTLRTKARLNGLMWLGIGVGVMLSFQAIDLYQKGEFKTEGYRVSVDFGGMFGNPNDMAIHLVIFIPIAIALGAATKNNLARLVYFLSAALMAAGSFVTQSRGAFIGMVAVSGVLVWKLGRGRRFKAVLTALIVGTIILVLLPGNYGLRVLSIFIPSLDPVGSSGQRTDLLMRSIWVTLRNPQGIGIGNFEIVGDHNLGTHNGFTQVSSELGVLALAAYLILLINPFRRLGAIDRDLYEKKEFSWIYYLSIGIQASIAGFMASSFFSSVAYHWYVYYPIAYAIGIRHLYKLRQLEDATPTGDNISRALQSQEA